jgi:hypothetical protein
VRRFFRVHLVFYLLFFWIFPGQSFPQEDKEYRVAVVGFYNLENLFDTIDDTGKRDEEFLPDGDNRWNSEKYLSKLDKLSEVIAKIGKDYTPDGVAILGISEIENREVVEDLINTPRLKNLDFDIVHYNSPDRRGVDVGMIYRKKYFTVRNSASYTLTIPGMDDFYTRDQLVVSGDLLGDEVHIIVNHWPSRRGGEKASRPLRVAAAQLSRHIADSLLILDPGAKIIVMGDLNDNPNNGSVKDIMRAKGDSTRLKEGDFYNPMYAMYKKGMGSNAWRDTWSLFDQVLLSQGLLGKDYRDLKLFKAAIFSESFLIQKDGRYKGYPWRTFGGGVWTDGYSDHFPVYVLLVKEAN